MCEHIPEESIAPTLETSVHGTADIILQQVLSHNQELMRLLTTGNSSTSNRKSRRLIPSIEPCQRQPITPT